MRTRTYGGVGGREGNNPAHPILSLREAGIRGCE